MNIHVIFVDDPDNFVSIVEKVKDKYEVNYQHKTVAILIKSTDTAQQVAEKIGFGEETKITGVVLKLNSSFSGYTERALWDWLDQQNDKQ